MDRGAVVTGLLRGVQVGDHNLQINFDSQGVHTEARFVAQRREALSFKPEVLQDREQQLALLADLAGAIGDNWLWWLGDPWSGKTALIATFVANPPPNVEIASFFIVSRDAASNNRESFLSRVIPQLAYLAGYARFSVPGDPAARVAAFHDLLEAASVACADRGSALYVVIDGLDEDTACTPDLINGMASGSIAGTLPQRAPANCKFIVSSRPNPPLPVDVRPNHPLRMNARVVKLTPSPYAVAQREEALADLRSLPDPGRAIAATVSASEGALSPSDIGEILSIDAYRVLDILQARPARSFVPVWMHEREPTLTTFRIGHDKLDETLIQVLNPRDATAGTDDRARWTLVRRNTLATFREAIVSWSREWHERDWPETTPSFLTSDSFVEMMLIDSHNHGLLTEMVVSPRHQQRALERVGMNDVNVRQLRAAATGLLASSHPEGNDGAPEISVAQFARLTQSMWHHELGLRRDGYDLARCALDLRDARLITRVSSMLSESADFARWLIARAHFEKHADDASDSHAYSALLASRQVWVAEERTMLLIECGYLFLAEGDRDQAATAFQEAFAALGQSDDAQFVARSATAAALGMLAIGNLDNAAAMTGGQGAQESALAHGLRPRFLKYWHGEQQDVAVSPVAELVREMALANQPFINAYADSPPRILEYLAIAFVVGQDEVALRILDSASDLISEAEALTGAGRGPNFILGDSSERRNSLFPSQIEDSLAARQRWSALFSGPSAYMRVRLKPQNGDAISTARASWFDPDIVTSEAASRMVQRAREVLQSTSGVASMLANPSKAPDIRAWAGLSDVSREHGMQLARLMRNALSYLPSSNFKNDCLARLTILLSGMHLIDEAFDAVAEVSDPTIRNSSLREVLSFLIPLGLATPSKNFRTHDYRFWAEYHKMSCAIKHELGDVEAALFHSNLAEDTVEWWKRCSGEEYLPPIARARNQCALSRWLEDAGFDDDSMRKNGLALVMDQLNQNAWNVDDLPQALETAVSEVEHADTRRSLREWMRKSPDIRQVDELDEIQAFGERHNWSERYRFRGPLSLGDRHEEPTARNESWNSVQDYQPQVPLPRGIDVYERYRILTVEATRACSHGDPIFARSIVVARAEAALNLPPFQRDGSLVQLLPQLLWVGALREAVTVVGRIGRGINGREGLVQRVVGECLSRGELEYAMLASDLAANGAHRAGVLAQVLLAGQSSVAEALKTGARIVDRTERSIFCSKLAVGLAKDEPKWAKYALCQAWMAAGKPWIGWTALLELDSAVIAELAGSVVLP